MVNLNRTQTEMLHALDSRGGEADTSQIREWIEEHRGESMTNSNIGQQGGRLTERGLIERTGSRDVGAPQAANVYGLTKRGEEVVEEVDATKSAGVTVGASEADVEALRSEVRQLSEAVDAIAGSVEALREDVADQGEKVSKHREAIGDLDARTELLGEELGLLPGEIEE